MTTRHEISLQLPHLLAGTTQATYIIAAWLSTKIQCELGVLFCDVPLAAVSQRNAAARSKNILIASGEYEITYPSKPETPRQ